MREEIEEIVEKLGKGEDVEFESKVEQPRTFVRYCFTVLPCSVK